MPTMQEVRTKFPQYNDLSDEQLADALHRKFYPDMAREAFNAKVGLSPRGGGLDPQQLAALERGRANAAAGGREAREPQRGMRTDHGRLGSAFLGAADGASFGFADEGAALLNSALGGGQYASELRRVRDIQSDAAEQNPGSYLAGQIGGGVGSGVGLAKSGLSLGVRAARSGGGLGRVAYSSALDGAIMGGLAGAGAGETMEDRAFSAGVGGAAGLALGGAIPLAATGASIAASPLVAPIASRLRPERYANQALGEGVRRSGRSIDDIAAEMLGARADGQDVFTVADAMGNAGQRMLSTVARTPNNARQGVIEGLTRRQMGQGERLANTLAEGFDAPDTATQRVTSLTAQRTSDAARNYGAARAGARPVDPSGAISAADDFLSPGPVGAMGLSNGIADDSIEAAVRRARSYLTDGRSVLSDFNGASRAKREIDAMIERAAPSVQRQLIPIRNALDDALADASPDYKSARDTFRRQSQVIDAVEYGRSAASPRLRASDTTRAFGALRPDQQQAFRAGYADPLIARVEGASSSPTTNRARMLTTEKYGREFPAFAAPGRGAQMARRIGREQTMFDTANAALGGSKTADNLADAVDLAQFDPAVFASLLQGRPGPAVVSAVTRAINESRGMPPQVLERLARALTEADPEAARALLRDGVKRVADDTSRRALANALMLSLSAPAAGRLAAP